MEVNSLQSQSDDLSGDDTFVPRLLFPRASKEKKDVVHSRDVPSEDKTASKQPATRKRKNPASSGGKTSTAKRPRTQNSTSAVAPSASRGRQLSCSPGEIGRWMDAIIPMEESDDEEFASFNAQLKFREEERPVDVLLRRLSRLCQDSANLDLANETDRKPWKDTLDTVRAELPVVMVMLARLECWDGSIEVALRSIVDSVTVIVTELQKLPGRDAVEVAAKDMQARYAGKDGQPGRYSTRVILYCLEKFLNYHTAIEWNALPEHTKDIRMKGWACELADGQRLWDERNDVEVEQA